MDGDPEPAPDVPPTVKIRTSDADAMTVHLNVDESIDVVLVEEKETGSAMNQATMSTTTPLEDQTARKEEDSTPDKVKRVLPNSPATPRNTNVLSPSRREYKMMYENLKRK